MGGTRLDGLTLEHQPGGGLRVEGPATVFGPDDPHPGVDEDRLLLVLRDIFRFAGGSHDDLDEYDRTMAAERRAAVIDIPQRMYMNPPAA